MSSYSRWLSFGLAGGIALLATMAGTGRAQTPATSPGAISGGPATGLTVAIIATKATYALDPAQTGQAFRDKLEQARKDKKPPPARPPTVDLVLRLTNRTASAITLKIGGDQSMIELQLAGPGAVTVPNMFMMTTEYRYGSAVKIAPGQSHDLPITSLAFGSRGIAECAFWTEPGEYTLTAVFTATTAGEKQLTVTSDPVKLTVEKADAKKP